MKQTKKLKKTMAMILAIIMLLVALPFTVAAADEDVVYPGGQVKVTYSFAKDIPEGCPCYLIKGKYDPSLLEYDSFENHWVLTPMVMAHPEKGYTTSSAFTAMGPVITAGEKLISYTYNVLEKVDVNSLDFSIYELQLYNNDELELDMSYMTYSVEVLSRGEEPATTEPATTEPATTEPATTEPVTTEPVTTEPVTTEPATTEPEPQLFYGDVDQDGVISIQDATLIQKFGVGINAPEEGSTLFIQSDVNGDGRISILDVTCVQKYIVGGYEDTGLLGK